MKKESKKIKHSLDSKEPNDEKVVFKPLREKIYVFFFVSIFGFSYFTSALVSEILQSENMGARESITSELSLTYSTLFTDGGFALRIIFNLIFLLYIVGYFIIIRRMEKSGKFIDKEATFKNKFNGTFKEKDNGEKTVTTP